MIKYFTFLAFCLLGGLHLLGQKVTVIVKYTTKPSIIDKSAIYYDSARKLTWADFKMTPDESSDAVALTSSGLGFDEELTTSARKSILVITVFCDFNKNASWVKSTGKSDYILNHEQHHFDISYIYTMLFIKKIKETTFHVSTCSDQLTAIYKQIIQELNDFQSQYDSETKNGIRKKRQEQWINKIDAEVASLKAFEK